MRNVVVGLLVLVVVLVVVQLVTVDDCILECYVEGIWCSFVAMIDDRMGFLVDVLECDGTRSVQMSIINIGAYMWSVVVVEWLGIIGCVELFARMWRMVVTLETLERHALSGQFYNWYDYWMGEKLTVWLLFGVLFISILFSVDNGWLVVGLKIVVNCFLELSRRVDVLYDSMNFGFYYWLVRNQMLFHYISDMGGEACCYDMIVSESWIVVYIGIAKGEVLECVYFGLYWLFLDTCDWSWTEIELVGFTRRYFGVSVYDGSLLYVDMRVILSWGGSMFEALMFVLFLFEECWGLGSWGANYLFVVMSQIYYGIVEVGYGYWGFLFFNKFEGGYEAYGVDGIGSDLNGYLLNNDCMLIDHGWSSCGEMSQFDLLLSAYTNGVVIVYVVFLVLCYASRETLANLARLERDFDVYTCWGFLDLVNVDSGVVSNLYLSFDQGMIMVAIGNAFGNDVLRRTFVTRDFERELWLVIGVEEFSVELWLCMIMGIARADWLRGMCGDDVICGGDGDDVIDGCDGDDALMGDVGNDCIDGGDDDDTLYGGEGEDELDGGCGCDVFFGGLGVDDFVFGWGDHLEEGE